MVSLEPNCLGTGLYIHLLDLLIRHAQAELANSRLDGVPARQARSEVDVAGQTKVCGVEDLVCARIVEDGLGVDTGLVREGAEAGDRVVEGYVHLNRLGNHILDLRCVSSAPTPETDTSASHLLEHVELVLALDILGAGHHHAGQKTAERGDAVALANCGYSVSSRPPRDQPQVHSLPSTLVSM